MLGLIRILTSIKIFFSKLEAQAVTSINMPWLKVSYRSGLLFQGGTFLNAHEFYKNSRLLKNIFIAIKIISDKIMVIFKIIWHLYLFFFYMYYYNNLNLQILQFFEFISINLNHNDNNMLIDEEMGSWK